MRLEVSVDELKAECSTLERAVRSASLATEESLQPHQPGGKQNLSEDAYGWLRYYAVLHRLHARLEYSQQEATRARADAIVLDALRSEPTRVNLIDGDAIFVYPKSLDALLHVHALDTQLKWMIEQRQLLEAENTAASLDMLPHTMDAMSYVYHLLCWIVTSEGPSMPYDPLDPCPIVPESIKRMNPWDLLRVIEAYQQHLTRLSVLSALIGDDKDEKGQSKRPSWSMFVGAMAVDLGDTPTNLMKLRALAELLAVARLNAAAKAIPETADAPD